MSMTSSVDAGRGVIARTSHRLSFSYRSSNTANVPNDNGRTVLISARKLSVLAAFAAAAVSSQAALAQISDDVVKIGVLTDMNGPASTPTGQGSVTAAQMAVDDFGGKVLGKPISIIVGDHQLKTDIGAGLARRWYDVDQVDLIVDVPVSAGVGSAQDKLIYKKKTVLSPSSRCAGFPTEVLSPLPCSLVDARP